ncbi:hypothetical protein F5144DRAFT_227588 [Chaetomium tenue]|uniref:Uncharacterized protein n=1 Tax=Chaetomium tenue TaxID=1854479 RepID=A0ACB7P947_9PEZI|nr:hypothetical protein F5144DRAFT_227588 [Chaetomium globosum]
MAIGSHTRLARGVALVCLTRELTFTRHCRSSWSPSRGGSSRFSNMQVSQGSLRKGDTEASLLPSEATRASGRRNKRPTPENADSPRRCRLRLLLQPRRRMVPTFRCFVVVRGLTLRKEAGSCETDPGMPPCVWSWLGTEQFQVRVFEMDDQETGNNDVGRNPGIGGSGVRLTTADAHEV